MANKPWDEIRRGRAAPGPKAGPDPPDPATAPNDPKDLKRAGAESPARPAHPRIPPPMDLYQTIPRPSRPPLSRLPEDPPDRGAPGRAQPRTAGEAALGGGAEGEPGVGVGDRQAKAAKGGFAGRLEAKKKRTAAPCGARGQKFNVCVADDGDDDASFSLVEAPLRRREISTA